MSLLNISNAVFLSLLVSPLLFLCDFFSQFLLSLVSLAVLILYNHATTQTRLKPPQNFHVIIVGAGFSGICMGKKLGDLGVKYTILEKSSHLGGTWSENTYPGCGCDIPSHLYSFSFFLNHSWSRVYSKQREILNYLEKAATKFGVIPNIKFDEHVSRCTWNKENSIWEVTTKTGKKLTANILVSGSGSLHVPHTPSIQGNEKFEGLTMHTAQWKSGWDPAGRRVGIIGTGASAVQTIPELAKSGVEKLFVFQRTACWSPCFTPERRENTYPGWVKIMFRHIPVTMTILRTFYFLRGELLFHALINTDRLYGRMVSKLAHWILGLQIKGVVKDPATARKLTPSYELGCKRITPSDYYLPAFNSPCVELVTESITEMTKGGIDTSQESYAVDTIIYATGFDLLAGGYAFEIMNKNGMHNKEEFGNAIEGYLGICHPSYPNFFWLLGPGTGTATNSVIYMIECQADFIVDCIKNMVKDGTKSVSVKEEVHEEYKAWRKAAMQRRVFGGLGSCLAWYKNDSGDNWTLWPSDLVRYWRMTRRCRWEEFDKTH